MSKVVRKQLLQAIGLLEKGTNQVGKLIADCRKEDCIELLTDCQDLAIAIGTRIEKLRGEGTATVSGLEEYCENIYTVGEQLQGQDTPEQDADSVVILTDSLQLVKKTFEAEFPDKREVVFLPYKASMWDSLESVWKAADADPECDAYVVPIPYYDKNPDGTFREFHYEGDLYPDYVPITRYEEYNVAERHPDVIYIHNPYDDLNFVTSVDPQYYSDKLRECTDELVYIPYFVLSDNEVTAESVKKFCLTKGVVNADKVIVQSEAVKQAYVQALEEFNGEEDLNGKKWREKILGLGSPKIEKIKNTTKDELMIPETWEKIITKIDGNWKKVIFYNTSLATLLDKKEQAIQKMRWVFDFFEKRKDEVALLWRPHPLTESTLFSMLPQLYQEYIELKQQYTREGWGIYDDSADLDRAIILCDGYYGDRSSVVTLCQEAGKKVMIQDVSKIEESNIERFFWASTFCMDEDNIWFIYGKVCVLCKYSLKDGKCHIIGKLPETNLTRESLFQKMILVNKKIFIIPCWAEKIVIYDIAKDEFVTLELDFCAGIKFNNAFYINDTIICCPSSYSSIISIDINTYQIRNMCKVKDHLIDKSIKFFNDSALVDHSRIVLVSPQSNRLYVYDYEKNKIDNTIVIEEAKGFNFVAKLGNKIVLCDDNNQQIYVYNFETRKIEKSGWPDDKKLVALIEIEGNRVGIDDYDSSWFGIYDEKLSLKMQDYSPMIPDREYYYSYLVGGAEKDRGETIYFNNCDASFNWLHDDEFLRKIRINISQENELAIRNIIKEQNKKIENCFCSLKDFAEEN